MTNFQVSIHFFLALAVILIVCRLVGRAVYRLGQPQVVGEMIAGVLLGPSLLGWLARILPIHEELPAPETRPHAATQPVGVLRGAEGVS